MISNPSNHGPARRSEWYTMEEAATAMNVHSRHAGRLLRSVDGNRIFSCPNPAGTGRPQKLYHYTARPELSSHFQLHRRDRLAEPQSTQSSPSAVSAPLRGGSSLHDSCPLTPDSSSSAAAPAAADDVWIARFRAQAVLEFKHARKTLSASEAALEVCEAWKRRPRRHTVETDQKLGAHTRGISKEISVGDFSESTLRNWTRELDAAGGDFLALLPRRKENVGRIPVPIDEDLLAQVKWRSISTSRADIKHALDVVIPAWRGSVPNCGISTWRRRMNSMDQAGMFATLAKLGIAAFRRNHSPDIERDWSTNEDGSPVRWNQIWSLDDATLDFYGHGFDPACLIRPYTYKVIRVSTRQWICSLACETPITQDQVRSLVGLAMCSPSGGVPEEIIFERGTIACDVYLEGLLNDVGVKVHRTSMDGGNIHPGSLSDQAYGHPQGKAPTEANIRRSHASMHEAPGQTGPEERHTAHAMLPVWRKEAARRAAAGEPLLAFSPEQWAAYVNKKDEENNNTPHGGLQSMIIDPETGKTRHMTPNEFAQYLLKGELAGGAVQHRVLPEAALPLFFEKGYELTVTENGIRINNMTYGRMEEDVAALTGKPVQVYAFREMPEWIYVVQLKRMVRRYVKARYGDSSQIEQKRAIERSKRNQFEALVAKAEASGAGGIIEAAMFTKDPMPERPRVEFLSPALLQRANALSAHKADREEQDAADAANLRFDSDPKAEASTAGRAARLHSGRRASLFEVAGKLKSGMVSVEETDDGGSQSWKAEQVPPL